MVKIETLEQLPHGYDPRLAAVLSEEVPDDVLVSFYYMNASPDPSANYRWELHRDGRLFYVEHSGKNITFENTFDRPLPKRPTKRLTDGDIRALYDQFDRADFFRQPGLQRPSPTEGGVYVVVRARRGDKVHDVVYENLEPPLVNYLYSITL